jgi:TonB family protein
MRKIIFILLMLFTSKANFGQISDSTSKIIQTCNSLELSYSVINEKGESLPFIMVEEMPEYPGGWDSLKNYIEKNLNYPKRAFDNNIQGKVFTSFTVDCKGRVGNVATYRGVDHDLDSTCIHVINSMPPWKPYKAFENSILIRFLLPVKFVITFD